VAVIDDASDLRLAADFAYYPPVPQTEALDWTGARACVRVGWEWTLLGSSRAWPPAARLLPRPTVLVTMGGSDPASLTLGIARALRKLDPLFRARFVIGPGMENGARIAKAIVGLAPHFETVEGASDLATEYAAADLALAAFGVTAYELAAAGVPAVYVCLTPDHAQSASAFERASMGVSLGVAERIAPDDVARTVWTLLSDRARLREMRAMGLATIDGEGANRIAADLARALSDRRSRGSRRAANQSV
jgi:spore coat polysaccharide biosynthesis protein SpsF